VPATTDQGVMKRSLFSLSSSMARLGFVSAIDSNCFGGFGKNLLGCLKRQHGVDYDDGETATQQGTAKQCISTVALAAQQHSNTATQGYENQATQQRSNAETRRITSSSVERGDSL
jgi:hypothetical protein